MLIVTNLNGESLPLLDYNPPIRTRNIDGTHTLSSTIKKTDKNSRAYALLEHEGKLQLDNNTYRIRKMKRDVKGNAPQVQITALHVFFDIVHNYIYDIIEGEKVLSLHQGLTHALGGTGILFKIEDDFDSISFENFGDDNSMSLFEKLHTSFGFEFNIENDNFLRIYKQIGNKTNEQLRWKHNIKHISEDIDTTNLSTFVKGFGGKQNEDDTYPVEVEYTSPNADKYDRLYHAKPIYDERFKHPDKMIDYIAKKLVDKPELSYTIEYSQLQKAGAESLGLGDSAFLIHEILDLDFLTRVVEVIDYPTLPNMKPIYTISSKKQSMTDKQVQNNIDKKSMRDNIKWTKNKQTELDRRMESVVEAVNDVENAMVNVRNEMDRIENEVLPEIEQAIEDTEIPAQTNEPNPDKHDLWWDTSRNPARLMRWDGFDWVPLAPVESEVDAMIGEAIDGVKVEYEQYTDEEIRATKNELLSDIADKAGLEYVDGKLRDKANVDDIYTIEDIDGKFDNVVSITKYRTDMDGIVTDLESHSTSISQNEKAIGFKADSSRVDSLAGTVSNHTASIDVMSDEISKKVSATYVDGAIADIEFGGRNYIPNSLPSDDSYWYTAGGGVSSWSVNEGELHLKTDGSGWASIRADVQDIWDGLIEPDTEYTFSYEIKAVSYDSEASIHPFIRWYATSSGDQVFFREKVSPDIPKNKWVKISSSDIITESAVNSRSHVRICLEGDGVFEVYFRKIQIEKGNKATDWTPAPEDMDARMSSAESEIKQLADEVDISVKRDELIARINVTPETILLDAAKVDIDGIVSIINDGGTTLIDGGRLINDSVTTKELHVNQIFGNSAVISKIRSDIVLTTELSASKIITGTLNGKDVSIVNLSATNIIGGTLDAADVRIKNLDASEIQSGILNAININGGTITGSLLKAGNNNTRFDLNNGNLHMSSADITLGGGTNIEFTSVGNRIVYNRNGHRSGIGIGRAFNDQYPYVFMGTSGSGFGLDPKDENYFSGFISNTRARRVDDGIGNSVVGRIFHVRDLAVDFREAFKFNLETSTNAFYGINTGDYDYDLGKSNNAWNDMYMKGDFFGISDDFDFRNQYATQQGYRMEVGYGGQSRMSFYGLSTSYYDLGKSNRRFSNIYLNYEPDVKSDERQKENIKSSLLGLDFINDIETKTFNLINNNPRLDNEPMQYGVTAQQLRDTLINHGVDVNEINMVTVDEEGYYGVQYGQLIMPTMKGLQELDAKVVKIENDTELLKLENQYLKQKVKQLEEKIA